MYYLLLLLFHEIDEGGEVVAISVEPDTAGMGAQGVALVVALLLEQVVATEIWGWKYFNVEKSR